MGKKKHILALSNAILVYWKITGQLTKVGTVAKAIPPFDQILLIGWSPAQLNSVYTGCPKGTRKTLWLLSMNVSCRYNVTVANPTPLMRAKLHFKIDMPKPVKEYMYTYTYIVA